MSTVANPAPGQTAAPGFLATATRSHIIVLSAAVALAYIAVATIALRGRAAVLLLDYGSKHFPIRSPSKTACG